MLSTLFWPHFGSISDALFASIHDAHLQESTLVDTCLQYQISTTDLQVNLLCINLLGTLGLLGIVIIGNFGQVFFLLGITDEKCH